MFDLPKPKTAQQALKQAIVWERAQALEAEGYTFALPEIPTRNVVVYVVKPGSWQIDYTVTNGVCDCPYAAGNGGKFCKHSMAAAAWYERQYTLHLEEQATEAEEMISNGMPCSIASW